MTQVFFWSFFSGYGKTSRLKRNSGTQNEWMTSFDSLGEADRPVGGQHQDRHGARGADDATAGSPLGAMVCG